MQLSLRVLGSMVMWMALCACGKSGAESEACASYFAKVEACAAKAPKLKGDILRQSLATTKENFAKNINPAAVEASCKAMGDSLAADPDCQ